MPYAELNTVGQNIQLFRNQPRTVRWQGQQADGTPADFSDTTNARYRIGTLYGYDISSQIELNWGGAFTVDGTDIVFTFDDVRISNLPIGTFLYEFQVTWDDVLWVTSHQGQITIAPSMFFWREALPV